MQKNVKSFCLFRIKSTGMQVLVLLIDKAQSIITIIELNNYIDANISNVL